MKRHKDKAFEYWSDSVSPERSVCLTCYYDSGVVYYIEDEAGREVREADLDSFDRRALTREAAARAADEAQSHRRLRPVRLTDIDPPGTYASDYTTKED